MASVDPWKFRLCRSCKADGRTRPNRDDACSCKVTAWRARWRGPDGASRSQVFARKVDAEDHLISVEHGKLTDHYVDPRAGKLMFKEYAERWRRLQVHHRDSTSSLVESHLRLHVYPAIGDRQLSSLQSSDLKSLIRELAAKLEPVTVKLVYGRVVAVMHSAVEDGLIHKSPCTRAVSKVLPKPSGAKLNILTPDEILGLANAMPERYRAFVLVGAQTGLRPGELYGLTMDRLVNFLSPAEAAVKVDRQLVRKKGVGVIHGPPKTDASYRTVPIGQATKDVLARHLVRFPTTDDGFIFRNTVEQPIKNQPFLKVWANAVEKAGLPNWGTAEEPQYPTPHDLRHHYASLLIAKGLSVKALQKRLGHASAKVTLDTYGHLWGDDDERTRDAVDEVYGDEGRASGWLAAG